MSLQACLTVPKKGRRHRNKKKQGNSTSTFSNDENEILMEGEEVVKNVRLTDIDDLQSMDVMDYMASVRDEANEMPDVFVSEKKNPNNMSSSLQQKNDIDTIIDGSAAACLYFCKEEAATKMTPIPISKDWMDGICHVFSQLRQYISTCHQAGVGLPPRRIPVPRSKNSLDWHIFCLGKNEAYGNANGYYDDESMDDDNDEIGSNKNIDSDDDQNKEEKNGTNPEDEVSSSKNNLAVTRWDEKSVPPDGHIPTVALLCQMDQVLTRRVLSHLLHYLIEGGWEMTRNRGQWIYSLLARLEKPLHREECSLLYSLLKHLLQKGHQIQPTTWQTNKNENDVTIITNTILVIIVVYFEQASTSQIFKMIN